MLLWPLCSSLWASH